MIATITDSNFSTFGKDGTKWAILQHEGVQMMPSLKEGILSLDISEAKGANWHGELRYSPFQATAGDTFTVSFSAKARDPFTFSVWLGQQNAPYASLVTEENHFGEEMMTAEWQSFSHTWHVCKDEDHARLNFVLGQIDNIVELRDVTLVRNQK